MAAHHLVLRTDYGSQADLTLDDTRDSDALTLAVSPRALWNAAELRQLARTLDAAAEALEADGAEWRLEMLREAGFVERPPQRRAA
jgi:hypothetical protein